MASKKRYREGDRLHASVFNALLDTVDNNSAAIEVLKKSMPTKTSQLKNDSGFLTEHQKLKTINGQSIAGSGNIKTATKTSELTNDSGFLTEHQKLKTINGQSVAGTGNIKTPSKTSELTTNTEIRVSDGAPIDATGIWPDNKIPEGTSVQNILEKLLLREILPSAAKIPSISLSGGTNLGTFIIGTNVTIPAITMKKSVGKFDNSGNVDANTGRTPSITWSSEKITPTVSQFGDVSISSGTTSTASATGRIELGNNQVSYAASANYSKPSNLPVTNLGNQTQSTIQVVTSGSDISAIWAASSTTTNTTVKATGVYPCYTNISGNSLVANASTVVAINKLSANYKEITLVDVPSENDSGKVHFVFEYPSGRTCTFQIKDLSGNFIDYAGAYKQSGTPEHPGYIRLQTTGDVYQGVNTYKLILSKALNS